MLKEKLIKMSPPSLGKFGVENSVKLVAIVAIARYLKTVVPMNMKFGRVLEKPVKVLEILEISKLFTQCLLGYHIN